MNYKVVNEWLKEHEIVMEESFTDALRSYAPMLKKNYSLGRLEDVYSMLGCNKTDVSRWEYHPYSTHALVKNKKLAAVRKMGIYLGLNHEEAEKLANRAGLSFGNGEKCLISLLFSFEGKMGELAAKSQISERMLQYYKNGMSPTKQALLAISISQGLGVRDIEGLLMGHGFCLSKSLPNDLVVLWGLKELERDGLFLYKINEILLDMELPLLMTRQ